MNNPLVLSKAEIDEFIKAYEKATEEIVDFEEVKEIAT